MRAGIDGLGQWSKSGLPFPRGVLPGEPKIRYFFHSERPELRLDYIDSGKVIDLIFHESELGVFDFWRLHLYAQSFTGEFPEFEDEQTLVNALVDAKQLSLIEPTDWDGVYRLGGGFLRSLAKFLRRNLTSIWPRPVKGRNKTAQRRRR